MFILWIYYLIGLRHCKNVTWLSFKNYKTYTKNKQLFFFPFIAIDNIWYVKFNYFSFIKYCLWYWSHK